MGTLLRHLPGLVCSAELAALAFGRQELLRARGLGEPPPRTIERLADPAFHARMLVCLNGLRVRAQREADDTLRFLVDAAQYYIEDVRGPAWDNPLVVACYYRDVAGLEGRPFQARDAERACAAYERDHQPLLERMLAERTARSG